VNFGNMLLNDVLHSHINGSVWDDPSATKRNSLGCICDFADGRRFRYVRIVGTTDLVAGDVVSLDALAGVTGLNESDISATFFGKDKSTAPASGHGGAIGDERLIICDVTVTITKNEYEDGYLLIHTDNASGDGAGDYYKIVSHDAITAGTVGAYDLQITPGLRHILDQTSAGTIYRNPWGFCDQAQNPTYASDDAEFGLGVVVTGDWDVSEYPYGWIQTRGPCPVKINGAGVAAEGVPLVISEDAAGCLDTMDLDSNSLGKDAAYSCVVARSLEAITSGSIGLVYLCFE